eukprot:TRINITY_DN1937_c0_g1_i3.p1 TRINITY_DN1937_c0_g1~~TRINITY_DN1937_c0_g1_i3.p1  ORF type:complete len:207 (+),score=25.72 TRINITY_DN1937_c0_g1_i3:1033-1653(+)
MLLSSERVECERYWDAHEMEVWVVASDRFDRNVLWSGSDDCSLRGWDVRAGGASTQLFRVRGDMGVTSIQFSPHRENAVVVGSYDESITLYDKRQMGRPLVCGDIRSPGGVWRLKWHQDVDTRIAAACMHGGCAILDVDFATGTMKQTGSFDEHQSMAYGIDWMPRPSDSSALSSDSDSCRSTDVVCSCSFYDNLLCLWKSGQSHF